MPITGIGSAAQVDPVASLVTALNSTTSVLNTRQVIAGTGLTGGGTLSADRTFAVDFTVLDDSYAQVAKLTDLVAPVMSPHRLGANVLPENTNEALRAMRAGGFTLLNIDAIALADGTLAAFHDTSLTRMTNGSGNAADQTALSWQALTIPTSTWMGGTLPDLHPAMLGQMLDEVGGSVCLIIEAITTQTVAPLLAELNTRDLTGSVIVTSRSLSDLSGFVSAGYRTMLIADDTTTTSAAIIAAGVTDVGFRGDLVTTANVDAYVTAGLHVHIYTITRQSDVTKFAGHGVFAYHSDDPWYTRGALGNYGYRSTTDRFALQNWDHGMVPSVSNQPRTAGQDFFGWNGPAGTGGLSNRGYFPGGSRWGMKNAGAVLQGWGCPVASAATSGNITFTVTFDLITPDTSRFAFIFFGCPDDQSILNTNYVATNNGYFGLIRGTGSMEFYKVVNGVQSQLGSTTATASVTDAGAATMRASWTPTTVTWARTSGTTGSITATDSTSRGGYFHLGASINGGVGVTKFSFGSITIT
jgi:glycerophosphoryl diester phosphodiesterase